MNEPTLSQQCLTAAAAINAVRRQLHELVKEGRWPVNSFHTISTILCDGECVERALRRLGTDTAE
jgi:hypothetical protein